MKVKLLKKVRRRYEITYWPNGLYSSSNYYKGPIMKLEDKKSLYRDHYLHLDNDKLTKEDAYQLLYEKLLKWIQEDYGIFKSKRINIKSEKLWYGN